MTNRQKILLSVPFYVITAAVTGFVVGFFWSFRIIYDTYKKDDPVSEMWSELDPTQ